MPTLREGRTEVIRGLLLGVRPESVTGDFNLPVMEERLIQLADKQFI